VIRGNHNYMVIARSNLAWIFARPRPNSGNISQRLEQQYPEDDKGWGATVVPLRRTLVGDIRPALLVLWARWFLFC